MTTTAFIEAFDLTEAQLDSENRTVRQRIIASGLSKNKRLYPVDVLEAAIPLFEGTRTFINHPSKSELKDRPERNARDITGWLDNVVLENGSLMATRHFTNNEAGRDSWSLIEQIVTGKAPASLMGASINAVGKGRVEKQDGEDITVVESIAAVISVDDVSLPAAGGGFMALTASDSATMTSELLKALDFDEWFESQPAYVARLKKEWQTVRLEDETKRVLAKADETVKIATTEAERLQADLIEVQQALENSQQANVATASALDAARRELAIEKAMRAANLPVLYEADLRTRLMTLPLEQWTEVIEIEKRKAKQTGGSTRVVVTGAGQQIQPVTPITESFNPLPRPGENAADWQMRIERHYQEVKQ